MKISSSSSVILSSMDQVKDFLIKEDNGIRLL